MNGNQNVLSSTTVVDLNFDFNYYGNIYKKCIIRASGFKENIWFAENFFLAPFAHDFPSTMNANIIYRTINDSHFLNQTGQEINSLNYFNKTNFMPTNAFIVTWVYSSTLTKQNPPEAVSFQVILSTDGSNSFLTINYGPLGLNASDGYYFQCGSYSDCYTTITSGNPELSSNVGVNGKWIYNISKLFKLNFIFLNKARLVYFNETRVYKPG